MTTADEFHRHYSLNGTAGWYDRLGPLRQAIVRCDGPAVLTILKERCTIDDSNESACWVWKGAKRSGYGYLGRGPTNRLAHRVAWEAARSFTQELGSLTVHHTCGVKLCINPRHLQAATHLENIAEMLGRRWYVDRIAKLEHALAQLQPDHPLLARPPMPLGQGG